MNDVTVLVDAGGGALGRAEAPAAGIGAERIYVVWEESRAAMPAEAAAISGARWARMWRRRRQNRKSLFNGPITRLIAAGWEEGGWCCGWGRRITRRLW